MTVTIVVGAQYGDEGKGKIVDWLSDSYDAIVRYNGGPNAGHTLVVDGEKIALHLVPSGILRKKRCILGNGVNINLESLYKESMELKERFNVDVRDFLYISDIAHVIIPQDIELSKKDGESTGKGIKESYTRKYLRQGIRICDLLSYEECSEDKRFEILKSERPEDLQKIKDVLDFFRHNIKNTSMYIHRLITQEKNILFEGAQGTGLDIDHGQYPYVTSSSCIAGGACTGAGVGHTLIDEVIGVAKVYITRVDRAEMAPLPTRMFTGVEELIRKHGFEFGATTGLPRRCGWFDVPLLKHAIIVNELSELILTKIDVLDILEEIPICTNYSFNNGYKTDEYPPNAVKLQNAKPVYKMFEGWKGQTSKSVRSWKDLPDNAKIFIKSLEEILDIEISYVSTGQDREDILEVQ